MKYINPVTAKRLGVSILSLIVLFIPIALAADFDFYAPDLISKESYRKISMDFRDASLKTILKVFSEQAGLNFIASQAVQDRSITLFLDNVPLQEAMNKIMSANNLIYDLEPGSNVFIVKEWGRPDVETITKVYNLKYTRLASSTLQKAISAAGTGASAGGGGAAAASGGSGGGGGAQAGDGGGTGIESSVKGVMTSNGKVMQDPRTNSLIVTDIPSQFELIDRVIALLDVPTPQVMIEVEMLDVSKRTVDQMGVKTSPSLMSLSGASRDTRFPNFFAKGIDLTAPTFTYGTLSAAVFSAVLDYLTTDTKTKFLARPRILSLSNETAEIKIITNEAIGLKTTTQSSEGAATQTQEAERYETGISLNVTPQVDPATGTVTMFIKPTVSQAVRGGTFGSTTFKDPEVRSSSTTLMVKDGETIVVGGLIRTNEETTVDKMPIVGDIPIIGALFRHKNSTKEERELIVFITPRIIGFDNASSFAKNDITSYSLMPYREQSSAVSRKEAVDNMLERWDN